MKPDIAVQHFGGRRALAEALGLSTQAVSRWVQTGRVPKGHAYHIQDITKGKVKVNLSVYARAR